MPVAISAPGKVLLAGGYLVLDKDYSGLVFGLSARIHSISTPDPEAAGPGVITVKSPQFTNAVWKYKISCPDSDKGVVVTQVMEEESSKNLFVETTLRYALTYISSTTLITDFESKTITILADNDYYSQPTYPAPRFNHLNTPLSASHKTGLGSSAALVTSLTACLLATYIPPPASAPELRTILKQQLIHNLAQASHCAAQGKVGSGFDVAAAVFGSCVYQRFSPSLLEAIPEANTKGFARSLKETVDSPWDLQISKTRVPRGIRVVMGDVDCGSSTPGMVKKLLAWRTAHPAVAKKMWDELEMLNRGLIDLLESLRISSEEEPGAYSGALDAIRKHGWAHPHPHERCLTTLREIGGQIAAIRVIIRGMGEAAGVPIEPEAQTKLLDAVEGEVNGVLGGVVPGAGGYDAVAFLLVDHPETVGELKAALGRWNGGTAQGKGVTGESVKALETREEQEGVRREPLEGYEGFVSFA
ncbi:uncharacterized protein LAJ45_05572 [Morchella importuna]|uniref:Phosphomevalonate kinase n=1 Tax=Morchella conica CCBAS932 TaxID=1392247 RepID=A0A3N4KTT8_9PEZI|nr:uncharacterized protein LAJ45_05572 [Morchella importuna]KAH8150361.1 hypothetical protein LAJ45_05572 [Morchella importuna]RPB13973.1 Phosphomevalonate kinase [Morchella conica CCBAS932]